MKHNLLKSVILSVILLMGVLPVYPKTIYLHTGGGDLWGKANAIFFIHSWDGSSSNNARMTLVQGDIYKANIPDNHTHCLFTRQDPNSNSINTNDPWNKTGDLKIIMDCFRIKDWGSGAWGFYLPSNSYKLTSSKDT